MSRTALTYKPKLGSTIIYFKPGTGKRVPGQVIAVYGNDLVDIRLASGVVVHGVSRMLGRQTFGSWGFVRGPLKNPDGSLPAIAYAGNPLDKYGAVWWKASDVDASGNVLDQSGNGLTLTNNGATYLPYKPYGINLDDSVTMNGVAPVGVRCEDRASPEPTTELEVVVRVGLPTWAPTPAIALAGKYTLSASTSSYLLLINAATGTLRLSLSDGTTTAGYNSTAATGLAAGTINWVKVTWRSSDGRIQFFTSTDGVTYAQLGADVTSTAFVGAILNNSTQPLELGAYNSGVTAPATGNLYRAIIRDTIGGSAIADFDASKIKPQHGPFYDDGLGNSWYGTGTAAWGDNLYFTDLDNNYVDTPDRDEFNINSSFSVEWTSSAEQSSGSFQTFGQKASASGPGWMAYLSPQSGTMRFYIGNYSASLGPDTGALSISGFTVGVVQTYRVTYNALTGLLTIERYEKGSWTTLHSSTQIATGAMAPSGPFVIGAVPYLLTANNIKGKFYSLKYWTDDVKRADVRFDKPLKWNNGAHTDPQGNVWTINRSALQSRLKVVSNSYVEHFGLVSERVETPDATEIDVSGDVDLRWRGSLTDATPSAEMGLLAKWNATGNQRSFILATATTGALKMYLSETGSVTVEVTSTALSPLGDNVVGWRRATWRQSDGRVQFFTSTDGVAWTQLGTDLTIAISSIFNGTSPLSVGSWTTGASAQLVGRSYEAQVWKGIPGVSASARLVANPKFTALTNYAPYKELSYLALSGAAGADASTPDHADLDILSDLTLDAYVALDDWTPNPVGGFLREPLISKYNSTSFSGYELNVEADGTPRLLWGDGSANIIALATIPLSLDGGSSKWLRATMDADGNLGSSWLVRFYTSDDGITWVQHGADVTGASVAVVAANATVLRIGMRGDATNPATIHSRNRTHRIRVTNGFYNGTIQSGTAVFDADFSNLTDGQTSFTEATGKTVTVNGTARIERRIWSFIRAALSARAEHRTGRYAYLPGVLNNHFQLESELALVRIPGDIDLRACVSEISLTGTSQILIGRYRSTQATRSYAMLLTSAGQLQLQYSDGTTLHTHSTTGSVLGSGEKIHLRATLDVDDGAGNRLPVLYSSLDGVNWTIIGANVAVAGTIELNHTNTDRLVVGSNYLATQFPVVGKIHSAELRDGIDGTIVASFDLSDALLMPTEPHTSFTDLYGSTWSVNRSTSGKKVAVVDRSLYLLGLNDYLNALDNDLFDFTAGESATIVLLARGHGATATQVLISKQTSNSNITKGWMIRRGTGTPGATVASFGDGANATAGGSIITEGKMQLIGMKLDVSTDQLITFSDNIEDPPITDLRTEGSENATPVNIGRNGGGSNHADMEFVGAAIVKRALTSDELLSVFDYLNDTAN